MYGVGNKIMRFFLGILGGCILLWFFGIRFIFDTVGVVLILTFAIALINALGGK